MNKKDLPFIIALFALLLLWPQIWNKISPPPPAAPVTATTTNTVAATTLSSAANPSAVATATVTSATKLVPTVKGKEVVLENENLQLVFSTRSAGVIRTVFKKYPAENKEDSLPVKMNFDFQPALSYDATLNTLFKAKKESDQKVTFTGELNGMPMVRTITLNDDYSIAVSDQILNKSSKMQTLPSLLIHNGVMKQLEGTTAAKGMVLLGADSRIDGDLRYWGRKLNKFTKRAGYPKYFTVDPTEFSTEDVDWVSAKNKFFAEVLIPAPQVAGDIQIGVERSEATKGATMTGVNSSAITTPADIMPGMTKELDYSWFIGPKEFSVLQKAGHDITGVMEFQTVGFWSFMNPVMEPARRGLLWGLVKLHNIIPNYGVAIIILTLLVRIAFWPITHKSTESMRRMAEIQPLIKELQAKHKGNPQELQKETMKLYKEHKVNPAGGCLPMFIQIPVFFALYTVLRSAIELRFSSFLWISDLSEPENLFAGMIPVIGSLNILPLLMTATMVLQQKLTPSSADAQQKQMMMFMPLMMLFIFYNMPSGLTLYWTTSNAMMIIQTLSRKKVNKITHHDA